MITSLHHSTIGHPPTRDTLINQRAFGSAASQRRGISTMYAHDTPLQLQYAEARRQPWLVDAARDQRGALVSQQTVTKAASVRRYVGAALIQAGQRVQGARRPSVGHTAASTAVLQTAR